MEVLVIKNRFKVSVLLNAAEQVSVNAPRAQVSHPVTVRATSLPRTGDAATLSRSAIVAPIDTGQEGEQSDNFFSIG